MVYSWDKANTKADSKRQTQYFEIFGNRAVYHEGWVACTTPPAGPWLMGTKEMPEVLNGYQWELYHIAEDFSESNNVAAKYPDKLREMQDMFLMEAAKFNVFPLDNSVLPRVLTPKPSYVAGRTKFEYSGELSGIASSNAPNILGKSFTITAEVEVPKSASGILVTHGGHFGGYALYLIKGKPVFVYNLLAIKQLRIAGSSTLAAGKHTIVLDFTYDGPGFGKGGNFVLNVDGKQVASEKIPSTIPVIMTLDETFDVGIDTRSGVYDADYQPPFPFNGTIDNLTVELKK